MQSCLHAKLRGSSNNALRCVTSIVGIPLHAAWNTLGIALTWWWIHRWLCELGIDNIVVDPASIEVNRRARRTKTDRPDAYKLLAMLIRHHAGERVWSVLHEPSPEDEDARREHRELHRLMHERIAHTNRIGSLLVLHNLRPGIVIGGATGLDGGMRIASLCRCCCVPSSSANASG
jgi:hypothetical protein